MNPNPIEASVMTNGPQEKTRETAYFHWLNRGCPADDDWADWFEAETEITRTMASTAAPAKARPAAPLLLSNPPPGSRSTPSGASTPARDIRPSSGATAPPARVTSHNPGRTANRPSKGGL